MFFLYERFPVRDKVDAGEGYGAQWSVDGSSAASSLDEAGDGNAELCSKPRFSEGEDQSSSWGGGTISVGEGVGPLEFLCPNFEGGGVASNFLE